MKSIVICVAAFMTVGACWGQTTGASSGHPAEKGAAGVVSARVFLITKGGDLKPARLARVYLLGHKENQAKESAYSAFLDERIRGGRALSPGATCREELLVIEQALKAATQWALENKQYKQIMSTEADEEGHFTIRGAPAGYLTLAILGQAGANEAYWEADVLVIPRLPATILQPDRLKTPERACSTLSN